MIHAIDTFSVLRSCVIVEGWSAHFGAVPAFELIADGRPLRTLVEPRRRDDVAAVHGPEAADWGFGACALLDDPATPPTDIRLRFADGLDIGPLAGLYGFPPDNPHQLFAEFVADVNARGGTVLEIGARARSGNESRGRFEPHVRYIGCDVVAGPNVDVVADAHHLSDAIGDPVDFVFSISTFEHLMMPWKAALEINRVLRPGGRVFTHSHQSWPVHDAPWDFFRFSKDGWNGLFNRHTGFRMIETRHGDPVRITSTHNTGGNFTHMDRGEAWGMSVCLAEKIAEPLVTWSAPMSDLAIEAYGH